MKKIYSLILFTTLFSKAIMAQYTTGTPTSVVNCPACTGTGWTIPSTTNPSVFFNSINHGKDLMTTGYFFSVPLSGTVTGIEVNYKYTALMPSAGALVDSVARLIKGGVVVGDDKAPSTPDYTVVSGPTNVKMGGAGDLWGTTWTAADFYSGNFGFDLKVKSKVASTNLQIVDGFSITIFYTSTPTGIKESQTVSPTVYSYNNVLYFPSLEPNQNAVLEIYDVLGQKVYEKPLNETIQQVDLGHLTKGLYVYKLNTGQRQISHKIYINN